MDIKNLVEEAGLTPKRKASTNGGEYSSPCPFCQEGDDRFLIWPQRHNKNGDYQGGRFSCRVCGKYGDAITFLCLLHGNSYKEACQKLRIEPKHQHAPLPPKKDFKLPLAQDPPSLWMKKAEAFVEWSHAQLMKNQQAIEHLFKRGFTREGIIEFKIGYNPQDFFRNRIDWGLEPQIKEDQTPKKLWLPSGVVIPSFSNQRIIKIKIRRSSWKEGDRLPKYVEISGSKACPSLYGNSKIGKFLVIESELDALLIQQFAADLVCCLALGGSTKPLDFQTQQLLEKSSLILFLPDFDQAGAAAWSKWKTKFKHIERIFTPCEKSAGDAYISGVDLRDWIHDCIKEILRKSLKTAPPK